jgi:hypothetical protein
VKLLFDQDLSRRLVGLLADIFPDSSHVALVGLDTASDREIWTYPATQAGAPGWGPEVDFVVAGGRWGVELTTRAPPAERPAGGVSCS